MSGGERAPFPPWLRELCYFAGLAIMLAGGYFGLKSDQRSTREELTRVSSDVAAIRASIPNKDVYDLKLKVIEREMDQNKAISDFEIAKLVKWKDDVTKDLIRKGIM